jgi:hypothetical protein
MNIDLSGFDNFQKKLKKLEQQAVSFDDLFTSEFMSKYTSFSTLGELLEHGRFDVNSPEDFEAITDAQKDELVQKTTSFSSWSEMLAKASELYTLTQLEL